MFDNIVHWLAFALYYASPAVAFGIAAMAWQRHPCRAFFLLAISCMLTVLIIMGDAVVHRHQMDGDTQLAWWRVSQIATIIDGILFPWSLFLLARHFQRNKPDAKTNPDEQPPS